MHSRNKCNFSRKVYFSNNWALSAFHSSLVSIPWSQGKLTSLETERNSDIKYSYKHEHYKNYKLFTLFLEETQFVQKGTSEPLMDLKKNHHRSWKYYIQKLLISKVFFTKVIKTRLLCLWQYFLIFS